MSHFSTVLRHSLTRPITNVTYALDYASWQLDPFGFHLTNALLHGVNILLVFVFVRFLALDSGRYLPDAAMRIALTTAGIFAVHPVLTEAVGYLTGRAELLVALWTLTSLLAFRSAFTTGSWASVVVGVAGFGLALGSKETGIVLPLVLLAYDRLGLMPQAADEAHRRRRWIVHAALLSLTALAAGVRAWFYVAFEQPSRAGFAWERAVAALDALAQYVSLLLIPVGQTFVHAVPPIAHIYGWPLVRAIAILGTILVLAFRLRRHHPAVSFGLLWTLVWLIPGVALVLLANAGQPMAERRAYLASCGLFLIVALLLEKWSSAGASLRLNRLRYIAAVATIAVVLSALTLSRNRLWSDPVLLWEDAVRKAPGTWVAQFGLADTYQAVGDCESAIPVYERAITVGRENVQAYDGLAACLAELQRSDEARDVLRTALERIPDAVHVRVSLAGLERRANHVAEAVRLCQEVRAMAPDTADARACLTR